MIEWCQGRVTLLNEIRNAWTIFVSRIKKRPFCKYRKNKEYYLLRYKVVLSVESQRHFGRMYFLHRQGRIISRAWNQCKNRRQTDPGFTYQLLSRWFLPRLIFRHWRWRRYIPQKRRLTFKGPYGGMSQKIALSRTTAVTISNHTSKI
jgi:hypothetical protein